MSFLDQLQAQADVLRARNRVEARDRSAQRKATEAACSAVARYLAKLGEQLDVLQPPAADLALDEREPWPAMATLDFRADTRQKTVDDVPLHASMSLGWRIVPREGVPRAFAASVNFPIEQQRIEDRLAASGMEHQRLEVRHPEHGRLQAIRYEYTTALRGLVLATPDHEAAQIEFRLLNVTTLGPRLVTYAVDQIDTDLLDELARLLVQQPSRFLPVP